MIVRTIVILKSRNILTSGSPKLRAAPPPNPMKRKLTLVGTIPPPIGGVSVHISRLMAKAASGGWDVELIDVHPAAGKKPPAGQIASTAGGPAAILAYWRRLLLGLGVVHYHVSGLHTFILANLPLVLFKSQASLAVTFHSGAAAVDLASSGPLKSLLLRIIFSRFDAVIGVGPGLSAALGKFCRKTTRLSTIPAFIPLRVQAERKVSDQISVVASGYGAPLYGWTDVADAVQACPSSWHWICCFYTTYDEPYYSLVRQRLERAGNVTCYENLTPDEFLNVLSEATIFLRPTKSDGDAVSLREALGLKVRCVASNCTHRPVGVRVYELGRTDLMCEALQAALADSSSHKETGESDFGDQVLAVYEVIRPLKPHR